MLAKGFRPTPEKPRRVTSGLDAQIGGIQSVTVCRPACMNRVSSWLAPPDDQA
jgi:hypothetical protein